MNKNLIEIQIIESVPIIGILNKVINANFEIFQQIEFYALYTDEIDNPDDLFDIVYTPDFIYEIARARAIRLAGLYGKIEEADFKTGMCFGKHDSEDFCQSALESNIACGAIKEVVVANLNILKSGDENKLLTAKDCPMIFLN